jgi:hypothetical protein
MLDLSPGDLLIGFTAWSMLRLRRQPSQQQKVFGKRVGKAVQ